MSARNYRIKSPCINIRILQTGILGASFIKEKNYGKKVIRVIKTS